MTRWWHIATFAIVAASFAGCMAGPTAPPSSSAATTNWPAPVHLEVTDCHVLEFSTTLTFSQASAFLPSQFLPAETGASGSGAPTVLALFGGASCSGGDVRRAYGAISAFPKNSSWRGGCDAGYEFFDYELDVVPGDVFAQAAGAFHGMVNGATVELSQGPASASVRVVTPRGAVVINTTGTAPAPASPNRVCEWASSSDGFLSFRYEQREGTEGVDPGTLTAAPGTGASRLFGSSAAGPTFVGEGTLYANATVSLFGER